VANYHVAARSLQIHESAQIYALALPLARFPFSSGSLDLAAVERALLVGTDLIRRCAAISV